MEIWPLKKEYQKKKAIILWKSFPFPLQIDLNNTVNIRNPPHAAPNIVQF